MKPKGKHPEKALNALVIRNATVAGKYADGNGLYLIVTPTGGKKWIWRSVVNGKRCEIGLGGAAPGKVSLAEARTAAEQLGALSREGKDVLAEWRARKNLKTVPTFKAAAEAVHEAHKKGWKNEKHAEQWISTLKQYVFPEIGARRIDQIRPGDVLAVLSPIWLEKPETARRIRQRIRTVFDWAKAKGYHVGENPVEGISKALPKQRDRSNPGHHAALPYAQVSAFLTALRATDALESTKLALEFVILTASRTSEAIHAKRREFDLKTKIWIIPAERMKSGRPHRVPLTDRCVQLIEQAGKLDKDSDYAFPGSISGKPLSNMTMLKLLKDMGHNATVHGFRSSFRDWAAERTNYPRDVVEMALAHTLKDKTEAAYKRTDLFDKRRDLMKTWASYVIPKYGNVITLIERKGK